ADDSAQLGGLQQLAGRPSDEAGVTFPSCRWAGPAAGGRRPCNSPKVLAFDTARPQVSARDCAGCELRDHEAAAEPSAPAPRGPCVHLGEATGERVVCPSCAGRVEIKLFACRLHGACTMHKDLGAPPPVMPGVPAPKGVPCCARCPDPAPAPG